MSGDPRAGPGECWWCLGSGEVFGPDRRVVTVEDNGDEKRVDLAPSGIEAVKREAQRRERRRDIMEDV